MSRRAQQVVRDWDVLDQRDRWRAMYARGIGNATAPEMVYYATRAARSRANARANRYSNVLPYDRTVVTVEEGAYINASVVRAGSEWWVAAQAPLPDQFPAFFRAILERTASKHPLIAPLRPRRSEHAILVQLTGWTEGGVKKADNYMPSHGHNSFSLPNGSGMHLTRKRASTVPDLGAEYTELELSDGPRTMTLHHYFYGAWPDHGVPEGNAVRQLRHLVREVRGQAKREGCEVWVHCSAGVGRTGTFLMLLSLLDRGLARGDVVAPFPSPLPPLESDADPIAHRVDKMREYRCMLVQTQQQLGLLYSMLS